MEHDLRIFVVLYHVVSAVFDYYIYLLIYRRSTQQIVFNYQQNKATGHKSFEKCG